MTKGRKIPWEDTNYNQHLFVRKIDKIPFKHHDDFKKFYEVVTRAENVVMYLVTGCPDFPREVCVFYKNGAFYHGHGKNFKEAIKFAIEDAIHYVV